MRIVRVRISVIFPFSSVYSFSHIKSKTTFKVYSYSLIHWLSVFQINADSKNACAQNCFNTLKAITFVRTAVLS